ncbi:MAG: D-alanyl-D-alanine dipeptidase [Chlorobiaceae bacterium]|nr:D-alanyl-D-alanine dipeptidase [Chlorobiaceae bacterium]MBA4309032.1 D-alanyl-D-alanine dipeptidase [Chlorobiaceae bacterium]
MNNIKNKIVSKALIIFLFYFSTISLTQEIPVNEFGLKVVESIETYQKLVELDSNKILVDLEKFIPGIILDIKYATTNNFTGTRLYSKPKAYLRLPAAKALKKIQKELKEKGLEVKIFDAYRPYSVTKLMWEFVKDDRYAADPRKGSRHNRGCAVDLTIVNSVTGEELLMPTDYDDFTVKAHHSYLGISEEQKVNRKLLRDVMEKHGFEILTSEWWHYDFIGWNKYELMNLTFEKLEKISK